MIDAVAQAQLVRDGSASPAELLEAAIGRVEALNPRLCAVVRDRVDRARAETAGDGPFRGVPLLLKDAGAFMAGEPAGYGLAAMHDVPWPETSYLARRFQEAGFVVLGRTTVPEMLTTVTSEPKDFPPVRNPWDLTRSAGGSSGGSAAAVASGMVAVAHGSDGGGSIRIPASECGLVGLKPSRGRISHGPTTNEVWAGASTDGVLTRSVRDTAAVLDVLARAEPGEPYYAPALTRPLRDEVGREPGRLRVGFVDRPDGDQYLDDPECRTAVRRAAQLLEELGHLVEPGGPGVLFDQEIGRASATIIAADTELQLQQFEQMLGRRIEDLEPRNRRYRERGRALSAVDHLRARAQITRWARRLTPWWDDHDVLLTPTVGGRPPELGWFTEESESRRIAAFIPYTAQFNLSGQPAISLPLHWTPEGLPVGVQLVAAYGREDLLVRLASQLEAAAPWVDRCPPVSS